MNVETRYSRTGLGMLALLVAFTAVWMRLQTVQVAVTPATGYAAAYPAPGGDPMFGFVEIPAGPFRMGSDPRIDRAAYANERWSPQAYQGRVDLPAYYIGRTEVTSASYRAYLEDSGQATVQAALPGAGDLPAVAVSFTDALAYGRWLAATLAASPDIAPKVAALLEDGWTITLPSEAQWEKAARGTDGRVFPWGNAPDARRANVASGERRPVASVACDACAYSLSDMSGNVWELTRSPYEDYPYNAADDGEPRDSDALYVMRGGSFSDAINNARAATRGGVDPGARRDNIGFRLVLTRK